MVWDCRTPRFDSWHHTEHPGNWSSFAGFSCLAPESFWSRISYSGSVVWFVGPWIAVHFYRTPALSPYLKLFALIMMLGALTNFFGKVLQGYREVARLTVVTDFVGVPLMMALTVVLVVWRAGLRGYIFAQVVSATVVLGLLLALTWKHTPAAARHLKTRLPRPEPDVLAFSADGVWNRHPKFPDEPVRQDSDRFLPERASIGNLRGLGGGRCVRTDRFAVSEPDFLAHDRGPAYARRAGIAPAHVSDPYEMGAGVHLAPGHRDYCLRKAFDADIWSGLRDGLAGSGHRNDRTTGQLRGRLRRVSSAHVGK